MDEQRDQLAPHVDKRVNVEGFFERLSQVHNRHVALVQDAVVTVSGEEIDLGHVWVQFADNFLTIEQGQRVTFLARVGARKRHTSNGAMAKLYNLNFPTAVRIKAPPALRVPMALTAAKPKSLILTTTASTVKAQEEGRLMQGPAESGLDLVKLISDVTHLAQRCGGWNKLEDLVHLLKH